MMKKEWNLIKLCLKYGLQRKLMLTLSVVFWAFGLFFEALSLSDIVAMAEAGGELVFSVDMHLSGMYFILVPSYFGQIIISNALAKLVQSSPYKKKIQTDCLVKTISVLCTVNLTVLLIVRLIECSITDYASVQKILLQELPIVAVAAFCVIIFSVLNYKHYVISIIFILGTYFPLLFLSGEGWLKFDSLPEWMPIPMMYVIIALGYIAGQLISRLFYKHDISSWVFRNALSKASR